MDTPTILVAFLSGIALFQILGLLSPQERVKGTDQPGHETFVDAKSISRTTPLRSVRQTQPAKWEIETEAGQKAIVYSQDNPLETIALNVE
jgi:hypothetical protein